MDKPLLPIVPWMNISTNLFDKSVITVHYEEYVNKRYKSIVSDFADETNAKQAVEYLKCVRILEPLIRFLKQQRKNCLDDPRSNSRLCPVQRCLRNFEVLIKPANQTTTRIVRHFEGGGLDLFKQGLPGTSSTYYKKGQKYYAEIQAFIL